MKMDKKSRKKLYKAYEGCPHYFFDHAKHHKILFDGEETEAYFAYTDYAIWLTTMGLLETLVMVDEAKGGEI